MRTFLARIEASCAPAKDICSCATTQCQNFAKHDLCRTHFAARSRRNFHVWRATASFRQSHGATGQRRSSLSSRRTGPWRVCGDFKVTVNPQLNVEQYPLPRIDDVFASLAGGKRFSKIDLKQAYLQMEMDDESSALLTLNTHKGLFKLNRLAFGVASAPALWQRSMDQILQGIPYTQCILDDIIVTGEDDAEHLRNLETVFRRLSEAGLRVNRLKCNFFQEHVEYCGHGVSARGLHKTPGQDRRHQRCTMPSERHGTAELSRSCELLRSLSPKPGNHSASAE